MNIERPLINGFCLKCKNCWFLELNEPRCRGIKLGTSDAMCVQVKLCNCFVEK
jgi:hypothetical protein